MNDNGIISHLDTIDPKKVDCESALYLFLVNTSLDLSCALEPNDDDLKIKIVMLNGICASKIHSVIVEDDALQDYKKPYLDAIQNNDFVSLYMILSNIHSVCEGEIEDSDDDGYIEIVKLLGAAIDGISDVVVNDIINSVYGLLDKAKNEGFSINDVVDLDTDFQKFLFYIFENRNYYNNILLLQLSRIDCNNEIKKIIQLVNIVYTCKNTENSSYDIVNEILYKHLSGILSDKKNQGQN